MRILSIIAINLLATAAIACPNLSGKYLCSSQEIDEGVFTDIVFNLSQSAANNVTTYNVVANVQGITVTQTIITDGVERLDAKNSDDEVKIYVSNTCFGDSLVSVDRYVSAPGSGLEENYSETNIIRLEGNQLVQDSGYEKISCSRI